ncbi:MAG: hypothetical protein OZ921_18945 [Sorangiineae bacterium]|nr:hypothetical protein [Polyangiaceae bacterium]MEB2324601.1 hypothetical protein [Sorangiineae bacterium]
MRRLLMQGGMLAVVAACSSSFSSGANDDGGGAAGADSSLGGSGGTAGSSGGATGGGGGATGGGGGAAGGSGGTAGSSGGATGGSGGAAGGSGGAAGGASCDPAETVGSGVFASPTGSDGTGDGSAGSPLATVGQALKLAATGDKVVYLDRGTYKEQVTADGTNGGVVIRGGWWRDGTEWKRDCASEARSQTVIESPTNTGVRVEGVSLSLETLTVKTKANGHSPANGAGETLYGVFVTGGTAKLTLTDVHVAPGVGGRGGAVSATLPGLTRDCDGLNNCANGASADDADASDPAEAGVFVKAGYVPGDGEDGHPGNAGNNGTPGNNGVPVSGCRYHDNCAGSCADGCQSPNVSTSPVVGGTGKCGCGGAGGPAGKGGRGGGGSVALFAAGPCTILVTRSLLAAGRGGDGSAGLAGSDGEDGKTGSAGASAQCWGDCAPVACGQQGGGCTQSFKSVDGGSPGTAGGKGGKGGKGGGGSGGPSLAIVRVAGATVQRDAASQATFVAGGAGIEGAPNGEAKVERIVP